MTAGSPRGPSAAGSPAGGRRRGRPTHVTLRPLAELFLPIENRAP
jgi:hypothetical protein